MARCDPPAFVPKTRAEQRMEWLESLTRPLTEAEQDELYRALHAIYVREQRIENARRAAVRAQHDAQIMADAEAKAKHEAETAALLARVEKEKKQKRPCDRVMPLRTFEQTLKAVAGGELTTYTMPTRQDWRGL